MQGSICWSGVSLLRLECKYGVVSSYYIERVWCCSGFAMGSNDAQVDIAALYLKLCVSCFLWKVSVAVLGTCLANL